MLLQLLDINKYIQNNKLMEVKTFRIPSRTYDEDGLWSESIFGPVGSKTRMEKFGYIDLKSEFIHPAVFQMVMTVSEETSKIVRDKGRYIVQDNIYIEDSAGETGIAFLIRTFRDIDFTKICHTHKKEQAEYIQKNKEHILINKFLVQPAGSRDYDIYNSGSKRIIDEVNNYYSKLLIYVNQLSGVSEIDNITTRKIQLQLNELSSFIKKNKMTGKTGLLRGTMLRKTMDYSSRLVLTNSPNIELGTIGLPWHTLVAIYEPFMIYSLFKKSEFKKTIDTLKEYTENVDFDQHSFSTFIKDLISNPDIIPDNVKNELTSVLESFLDEQVVLCKRDPVVQRKSWFAAKPVVTEGRVAYVNSMDLSPLGGDCVKGNIITYIKNENGNYIKNIESIDNFYNNHNLEFINKYVKDGSDIEVYDFLVKDEIYSIGMNEYTKKLQYAKIQKWSIHNNINIMNMYINGQTVPISTTNSCYVYDNINFKFKKLNVNDVIDNPKGLMFIRQYSHYEINTIHRFIPAHDVAFHKYQNDNEINININDINIKTTENKIAYDLTMNDNNVRSFLHSSLIVQCNSDGDTVAVVPIFTNEAKQQVNEKMNPINNKSKWKDLSSSKGVMYGPELDAIATIYKATKL